MLKEITSLNEILTSYKIKARCVQHTDNKNFSFYDLELKAGGKVKDIIRFADEISLALKSTTAPSIDVRREDGVVRIGFAKSRKETLNLFDIMTESNSGLNCILGEAVDGTVMKMDIAENPHMIISGATGSGKSVLLHAIIANLFNNNNVKVILMDPKDVEFAKYAGISGDVYVKNTFDDCLDILKHLSDLMDVRYAQMKSGIKAERLPYIVCVIDEFADLIMQDEKGEFQHHLTRLAQKSRAAKIHIILATQRPTVNIITGTIKANFPARIACRVASYVDSKVIIDTKGAENLMGKGDALLKDNTRHLERFQVAFVSPEQVYDRFKVAA